MRCTIVRISFDVLLSFQYSWIASPYDHHINVYNSRGTNLTMEWNAFIVLLSCKWYFSLLHSEKTEQRGRWNQLIAQGTPNKLMRLFKEYGTSFFFNSTGIQRDYIRSNKKKKRLLVTPIENNLKDFTGARNVTWQRKWKFLQKKSDFQETHKTWAFFWST